MKPLYMAFVNQLPLAVLLNIFWLLVYLIYGAKKATRSCLKMLQRSAQIHKWTCQTFSNGLLLTGITEAVVACGKLTLGRCRARKAK